MGWKWGRLIALGLVIGVVGCQAPVNSKVDGDAKGQWIAGPLDPDQARKLQEEVDNGHRVGLMDPTQVALEFLDRYLKAKSARSEVVETREKGIRVERHTLEDGRIVELRLVQPVRKAATGIWAVEKYRFVHGG